jgi:hypothetical protein
MGSSEGGDQVNITIKVTHASGTVTEVSIPMGDSVAAQVAPAVVTPDEVQVASEPAIPAASGLVDCFGDEVTKDDLKPSGNRYKSVEEFIGATLGSDFLADVLACENTLGKERVGEEGEGDGRIGGTGERKEEGGEGEGGEENLEQFKCTDGLYSMPPSLYSDFCSAFGHATVDRELRKARLWMDCNPTKRKTRRGMSRYLNAWLCRAQGEKRQPLKGRSGSLLESANTSQQGW